MKPFLTIALFFIVFFSYSKDKGKGMFYVSYSLERIVKINIYEENNFNSRLAGVFVCEFLENGQSHFKVQAENIREDNLIEFEYEKLGLPLCDVKSDWIEVIYGYGKSGKILTGWVQHRKEVTNYFIWKDYLKSAMLFFESPDQISFFDKPNGVKKDFKLTSAQYLKYDYIMKPLEMNGNWMKVEVTTPSDYCNNPKNKTIETFWIKYLSEKGRPLVWYFTRGC